MKSFFTGVFLAGAASVLSSGHVAATEVCPALSTQDVVNMAIDYKVRDGNAHRKAARDGHCSVPGNEPPCADSIPYSTRDEFKAENPDCCEVYDEMPGDYRPELRPYYEGKQFPRIYFVRMRYLSEMKNPDGKIEKFVQETTVHLDCFGNSLNQGDRDKLVKGTYEAD